jgi:hypothetical protein
VFQRSIGHDQLPLPVYLPGNSDRSVPGATIHTYLVRDHEPV